MRHFGNAHADFVVHQAGINPPGIGEFFTHLRVRHVLIARELIWQHAHVTRSLHVVLPTHRANADGFTPEVTGQQRQACQPFHHVNGLAELGDPHAPHDGRRRRRRISAHRLTNLCGGNTGQFFHRFGRVVFNDFTHLVQPGGVARNILFVVQLFFQQHMGKGIHQRHIATVTHL